MEIEVWESENRKRGKCIGFREARNKIFYLCLGYLEGECSRGIGESDKCFEESVGE